MNFSRTRSRSLHIVLNLPHLHLFSQINNYSYPFLQKILDTLKKIIYINSDDDEKIKKEGFFYEKTCNAH